MRMYLGLMPSSPVDPADAIATALSRLRARRMPKPPWGEGPMHRGQGPQPADIHGGGARFGPHGAPGWGHGARGHGHGAQPWAASRLGGPARMRLLEALAQASHPLSIGEIAQAVGVDQPRASRLVQQAVDLGLTRREVDPNDARRTRVALTDAGRRLVRGFRGERREAIDAALSSFTEDERAELARLLTKLADSWPQV